MSKSLKIKVIGVGGSGVNAISRMVKDGVKDVELIAVNTDASSLQKCPANYKILIGPNTTQGLGAGMNLKIGEKAARESYDELKHAMEGAQMVFLTCGLGGGSGTSGIAVLGEIAKSLNILTVGVVTLPFSFEGLGRRNIANTGLKNLFNKVDTLLTIHNDKLLTLTSANTTIENAFWLCDSVLREAVKGISDLVSMPGIINVDFADLKGILENTGRAFLGQGKAKGDKRAFAAANMAMHSPLLSFALKDAQGILLNIAGKDDLTLAEVNAAATFIKTAAPDGTKIIFGVSDDPTLKEGEIKVTVIATSKD